MHAGYADRLMLIPGRARSRAICGASFGLTAAGAGQTLIASLGARPSVLVLTALALLLGPVAVVATGRGALGAREKRGVILRALLATAGVALVAPGGAFVGRLGLGPGLAVTLASMGVAVAVLPLAGTWTRLQLRGCPAGLVGAAAGLAVGAGLPALLAVLAGGLALMPLRRRGGPPPVVAGAGALSAALLALGVPAALHSALALRAVLDPSAAGLLALCLGLLLGAAAGMRLSPPSSAARVLLAGIGLLGLILV